MNISTSSAGYIAGFYSTQSFDRRPAKGSSASSAARNNQVSEQARNAEFPKSEDSTEKEGGESYIPLLPEVLDEDTTVSVEA